MINHDKVTDGMRINMKTRSRTTNIDFFQDARSQWRFRMSYENGQIAGASTAGRDEKSDMIRIFERLVLTPWRVSDQSRSTPLSELNYFTINDGNIHSKTAVKFYTTGRGHWRWTIPNLMAPAKGTGGSTEGYVKKRDMIKNFEYVVLFDWKIDWEVEDA